MITIPPGRRHKPLRVESLVLVLVVLLASACGVPGTPSPNPALLSKPLPTPRAAPSPEEAEAIIGSRRVRRAVVRVVAEGAFAAPEEGAGQEPGGSGSGFIIDSTGVVVTTHHLVTGARRIRVYLDGETRPRDAEVLGVSECADLAVVAFDGGTWPFLEWHDGDVAAGMDVYAGGYERGETDYSFKPGTVADELADGNTAWASVDSVIAYDADTPPGYAGGPLLAGDGKLVGVHYGEPDAGGMRFALGKEQATELIQNLIQGEDAQSIGVNGRAATVKVGEQDVSGIWVSAVKSGSPAARALLKPGDLLLELDGRPLAQDGTLADYCAVLRDHRPDDALDVRVLRPATQQILAGQINGPALAAVAPPPTAQAAVPTATPLPPTPIPLPTATPVPSLVTVLGDADAQALRDAHPALRGQFRQLLFDTFDGRATTRRWTQADEPLFARTLRNSYYALTLKQKGTSTSDVWRQNPLGASYIVELDVNLEIENPQGTFVVAGIAFDVQENGDGLFFAVRNDRSWIFLTVQNGQIVPERSGLFASSAVAGGTNQMRVVRLPDQTQLWVNNTPVSVFPAGPFAGGFAGVLASPGSADLSAPVTAVVDNFRVMAPP